MSNNKTKLLLIFSLILVSLLSNKLSTPFFEFEGKGIINPGTALAVKSSDPSRNNTDMRSTTSTINQTNNASSEVSTLVNKGDAISDQGSYTQAIQYYDKALGIDPNNKDALNGKGNALSGQGDALHYQGNYMQAIQYYDKALAIDPRDTYALDAIGKVFADQSNYSRAMQYYDKALAVNSTDSGALFDKQNAISKIVESGNTSGYDRGCINAQISNLSERYVNQFNNGPSFHNDAFMLVYNEGFHACSGNLPNRTEILKMFNVIVLKGNVTDETANTRICTTVSEGYPQTICQNLDNLKPENNSNSIESNIFTFENVPVNASFHSCIQRLIYPNVTLCYNYGSKNYQGPTVEQLILQFFGVDPPNAEDDEGYTSCPL